MNIEPQHPTFEDVAGIMEEVRGEILNTQTIIRDVEVGLRTQIHESEQRLLTAVRGTEDQLREMGKQLARIEEIILESHERRLAKLEEKVGIR